MSNASERLEVEMKFPVPDFQDFRRRLRQLKGLVKPTGTARESDQYFNAPDRDFAQTDEALRVRAVSGRVVATYKGPKIDAQTKTRKEIEVEIDPAEAQAFCEMLRNLGYRDVAVVRKRRRIYKWKSGAPHRLAVEICLDEVDGVGRFIELETIASRRCLEAARAVILKLATDLGLGEGERRSYLEMFLTNRGSTK